MIYFQKKTVSRSTDMECKPPPEYVPDKVLDHRDLSEDLSYTVRALHTHEEKKAGNPQAIYHATSSADIGIDTQ